MGQQGGQRALVLCRAQQGPAGPGEEGGGEPLPGPLQLSLLSLYKSLLWGEGEAVSFERKQARREEGRRTVSPHLVGSSARNPRMFMVTGGAELSLHFLVVLDLESNVYPLLKEVHQH